jgi:circadian clock protein KaiB
MESGKMKARKRREEGRSSAAGGKTYIFKLFLAGNELNSTLARGNLARLCEEHLKGRYKIETVNVLKNGATAHKNNVLVTPTLILIKPHPKVTVFGNLSDTGSVLAALRLNGGGR